MKNYILADLSRVLKKKSFIFTLLLYILLFGFLIFVVTNPTFTSNNYVSYAVILINIFPLLVGIPMFLSIYNDDFKSKSMQIAIGYGISRKKVILTKIIDTVILSIVIGILFAIVLLLIPLILKLNLTMQHIQLITINLLTGVILIIGYTAISTILLYATENAIFGIITFILLASGTIAMLIDLILGQKFITNTFGNVSQYLFTNAIINTSQNLIMSGHCTLTIIPILLAYIVLPVIISMILFEKKELEF